VDGKYFFSNLSGYKELDNPHQSVDEQGVNAIEYMKNSDKKQTLYALKKMEDVSMVVLRFLEQLANSAESRA
jgi:hypothetical protein